MQESMPGREKLPLGERIHRLGSAVCDFFATTPLNLYTAHHFDTTPTEGQLARAAVREAESILIKTRPTQQ